MKSLFALKYYQKQPVYLTLMLTVLLKGGMFLLLTQGKQ